MSKGATSVNHLTEAVVSMPLVSVRSWVLVLHTLCLLINQRSDVILSPHDDEDPLPPATSTERSNGLSSVVLTDANLVPLIIKFLSSAGGGMQFYQVGFTIFS